MVCMGGSWGRLARGATAHLGARLEGREGREARGGTEASRADWEMVPQGKVWEGEVGRVAAMGDEGG